MNRRELFGMLLRPATPWVPPEARPHTVSVSSENCVACNVCSSMCPQGALAAEISDGWFSLSMEPDGCNGCGICGRKCLFGAIQLKSGFGSEKILVRLPVQHCEKCNELSAHVYMGYCAFCARHEALSGYCQ